MHSNPTALATAKLAEAATSYQGYIEIVAGR
jgi:hypothetical protein